MRIPGVMLRDTLTVEPYAGATGAGGPSFGAAETHKAHVEPKHRLVQTPDGEQAVSAAVAYLRPGASVPVGSRVTWNGQALTVLAAGELARTYLQLDLGGAGEGAP